MKIISKGADKKLENVTLLIIVLNNHTELLMYESCSAARNLFSNKRIIPLYVFSLVFFYLNSFFWTVIPTYIIIKL